MLGFEYEQEAKRFLQDMQERLHAFGLTLHPDKTQLIEGRAINIACRLQGAVKDKGENPAYKALVSNVVYAEYFKSAKFPKIKRARRTLRNINNDVNYECRKIELVAYCARL